MYANCKSQSGFAVPATVIAIAIAVIFAAAILPNALGGPAADRDTKRKNDLKSLKTALDSYYKDKNTYPSAGTTSCIADDYSCLGEALTGGTRPYMTEIPKDPSGSKSYVYSPTPENCGPGACTGYEIRARLERGDKAAPGGRYVLTSAKKK